jgi:hypothetical protein
MHVRSGGGASRDSPHAVGRARVLLRLARDVGA